LSALSELPVISIIDDDASVRTATQNLIRSLGYSVHMFASAEAFLDSPQLNSTSCVIADVQMPDMNGVDLQYHLRSRGYCMPFIFISAFPEEAIRQRALRDGAKCFLAKPFDGCVLIDCLNTALAEYRAEATEG
jgi:FixJ family two-component response regulator